MFSRWLLVPLGLCMMVPSVSAQSSPAAVRSALQAQYNRYTTAIRKKDIKEIVTLSERGEGDQFYGLRKELI